MGCGNDSRTRWANTVQIANVATLSKMLLALSNLHTKVQYNQSSQSIFALQLKLIVVFSKNTRAQLGLIELQYCNQFKQSSQARLIVGNSAPRIHPLSIK
jgi:hypothetical protein